MICIHLGSYSSQLLYNFALFYGQFVRVQYSLIVFFIIMIPESCLDESHALLNYLQYSPLLGASEITAILYCNCSIFVFGLLRDLQYVFALLYGTPSTLSLQIQSLACSVS